MFVPDDLINNIPAQLSACQATSPIWTNDGSLTDAYMRHSASMSENKAPHSNITHLNIEAYIHQ